MAGVRLDWDGAEAAGLVVLQGLEEPLAGQPAQDQHVKLGIATLLAWRGIHGYDVIGAVDGELTHAHRPPLDTHRAGTGEDMDQSIEARPPGAAAAAAPRSQRGCSSEIGR